MWDDLPSDVLVRILVNLLVKDVIRSTLLHKSIYTLVHSKFFINAYNQHSLLYGINPPLIFLQFLDRPIHKPEFSLRFYSAGLDEYMPLHFPFQDRWLAISNFCNSLVCLFDDCNSSKPFILWNPYIRKTLTLPKPNHGLGFASFLGLGFVDESSDYRVLMVNSRRQAEFCSLQHNSWKIVAHPGPGEVVPRENTPNTLNPVYVKGSLYWIRAISEKLVVGVFDFKDEIFSDISLPDNWDSAYFLGLRVHTESSIAVVRDVGSVFHIQIMDVNAKEWNKHATVAPPGCRVTDIIGFNKEGDEIVECERYNKERERIKRIGIHRNGECVNVIDNAHCIKISNNYVCNLALLDIVGENH